MLLLLNPRQDIQDIKLSDLVLWTENPRQPIGEGASVNDIIKMAIEDKNYKWNLKKLCNEMGSHYDTSEIPTVVKKGNKYIVYDGNRRVALIKFLQNPGGYPDLVNPFLRFELPNNFRSLSEIPCNVCDEKTALYNVRRKHIDSGSWNALERDIFLNKYMNEEPSDFLIFERATKLISKNKELNKDFVKKEILKETNMNNIGFSLKDKKLWSVYNNNDAKKLLQMLGWIIREKEITTRTRLGWDRPGETLKDRILFVIPEIEEDKIISVEGDDDLKECSNVEIGAITLPSIEDISEDSAAEGISIEEKRKRTPPSSHSVMKMFPYELVLEGGEVNDVYSDIIIMDKMHHEQRNNPTQYGDENRLSGNFYRVIRFALRLLVEIAANKKHNGDIEDYVKRYFQEAYDIVIKKNEDDDLLSINRITTPSKLTRLLQTGGHAKKAATSEQTTCAMSIVVGKMLEMSHGKEKNL